MSKPKIKMCSACKEIYGIEVPAENIPISFSSSITDIPPSSPFCGFHWWIFYEVIVGETKPTIRGWENYKKEWKLSTAPPAKVRAFEIIRHS